MIDLKDPFDYVVLILVAALAGLVGGLAAYGLQSAVAGEEVNGGQGQLAFGWSILLGAVAAVAFLYFFPPQLTVKDTGPTGKITTSSQYDLIKTVALGLIVGSGGRAFLAAMQARALATLRGDEARALATQRGEEKNRVTEVGKQAVQQTANVVTAKVPKHVQTVVTQHLSELNQATQPGTDPVASAQQVQTVVDNIKKEVEEAVTNEARGEVDATKNLIDAAKSSA